MADHYNGYGLKHFAATIAECMELPVPESYAPSISWAADILKARMGGAADRVVLYHADAVGMFIWQKYTNRFAPVYQNTSLAIPFCSTIESYTPVAHASMYTGLKPKDHGIQANVKPVLTVPTLFDAAIQSGHRPIIISTEGDSISKIFLERNMDYIICATPDECNAKAEQVLEADQHDLITVYNGNYDAVMHRYGPEAEDALAQLRHNGQAFEKLSAIAKKVWAGKPGMAAFLPDHGCHEIDGQLGSHGLDMAEDMNIIHFYQFYG